MITIQYLEPSPELENLTATAVVEKLRLAAARLPVTHLLVGWDVPVRLLEACRKETERLGMRFLRWQPLLTGDGNLEHQNEWKVTNLSGEKVGAFREMPEFSFACPNHPQVQAAISRRIEELLSQGIYQGFFLDRLRFPSPASDPPGNLGCFCEHCRRKAAAAGLDLEQTRRTIRKMCASPQGCTALVEMMLGKRAIDYDPAATEMVGGFLEFRQHSITALVQRTANQLKSAGMEVGLDCFSPALAGMVGQDLLALSRLSPAVDWIKIMCYAHTLGPAGLPFELLGLLDFLTNSGGLGEAQALASLSQASSLRLPASRQALMEAGISPRVLGDEVRRALADSAIPILPGIELVEVEGVTRLNNRQIAADLAAVRKAGAAGLALSWDLRRIPLERLEHVRTAWMTSKT